MNKEMILEEPCNEIELIDEFKRFPLHINRKEYDELANRLRNASELTENDKELIFHVIHNATFWKNKYITLTEKIQNLYADEQLNMGHVR